MQGWITPHPVINNWLHNVIYIEVFRNLPVSLIAVIIRSVGLFLPVVLHVQVYQFRHPFRPLRVAGNQLLEHVRMLQFRQCPSGFLFLLFLVFFLS